MFLRGFLVDTEIYHRTQRTQSLLYGTSSQVGRWLDSSSWVLILVQTAFVLDETLRWLLSMSPWRSNRGGFIPRGHTRWKPWGGRWTFSLLFLLRLFSGFWRTKKKKRKKSFVAPFSLGFEWKFSLDQTDHRLVWTLREMLETSSPRMYLWTGGQIDVSETGVYRIDALC